MEYAHLTRKIIGAALEVHHTLGPGYVESIYQRALVHELQLLNMSSNIEIEVSINYKDRLVGRHRLDVVVENLVIVELKAISGTLEVHTAQVLSYLAASGLPVALLFNFGLPSLQWKRLVGKSV